PRLSDVSATLDILRLLGCRVTQEGDTVRVDASTLRESCVPDHLMGELRSSVTFLGALLSRCGGAELAYPGGCQLGPRPIDLHLMALRTVGAQVLEQGGRLVCRSRACMRGQELCLSIPSGGATENAMLAAVGCEGVTTIVGAAREPEIEDLQAFLRAMGAEVEGAGGSVIKITGGKPLHPAEHTVIGDRMVAATYLCATGAAGGCVTLTGVEPHHLTAVLSVLEEAGADIHTEDGIISMACAEPLCSVRPVRTAPHPGFPTDAQAPLMAALSCGTGTTMFVENMFLSRYGHVGELVRMGADIQVDGRVAVVTGRRLHGAAVRGTDLRGGAALVVAALAARGESRVSGVPYILRGYEDLDGGLRTLGAQIQLV
ncbi:MAG: UDP-N-acetylglucosamine 1-carboxyvinyltransferase, partial [Oscillibacter sp.]|nr:UDP-N-acetylglucosamine 1-carboxyvinyltransferase [Oscillibacter sp.]